MKNALTAVKAKGNPEMELLPTKVLTYRFEASGVNPLNRSILQSRCNIKISIVFFLQIAIFFYIYSIKEGDEEGEFSLIVSFFSLCLVSLCLPCIFESSFFFL